MAYPPLPALIGKALPAQRWIAIPLAAIVIALTALPFGGLVGLWFGTLLIGTMCLIVGTTVQLMAQRYQRPDDAMGGLVDTSTEDEARTVKLSGIVYLSIGMLGGYFGSFFLAVGLLGSLADYAFQHPVVRTLNIRG
jgi:hypothetical protein